MAPVAGRSEGLALVAGRVIFDAYAGVLRA